MIKKGKVLFYSNQEGMHRLLQLDEKVIDIEYGLSPYIIEQLKNNGIEIKCAGLEEIGRKEYWQKRKVALKMTDEIINALMSR